jgi:hypothetical protein
MKDVKTLRNKQQNTIRTMVKTRFDNRNATIRTGNVWGD